MARRSYEVLDEAGGVTLLWPSPEAHEPGREWPRPEQRAVPRPEPARRLLGFSPPGATRQLAEDAEEEARTGTGDAGTRL